MRGIYTPYQPPHSVGKQKLHVRRLVHGMGYRYRLHKKSLYGTPDLVFSPRKKVIFVHGCFWHRHEGCRLARLPKCRQEFWLTKLNANRDRDAKRLEQIQQTHWKAMVIWECELKSLELAVSKMTLFLEEQT